VRFLNIIYAARIRRLAHYEIADRSGMSASRLSRCMNGRSEFTDQERTRIAQILAFEVSWLFCQPIVPEACVVDDLDRKQYA
jgi:transcriptional regulator with XRE-family HTH domain